MRVEGSANAVADLQQLSSYIEEVTSLRTANRFTRTIYEAAQSLKNLPNRGRPGRIQDTRELVVSNLPYIVMYQVLSDRVLILNIVHGAQEWP